MTQTTSPAAKVPIPVVFNYGKPRPIPFDMYVGSTGCTTYAAGGERGTVTAFYYRYGGPAEAAFVQRIDGEMWVIDLGATTTDHHRVIAGGRRITRDDFDRIVGIDALRREMGWVE